MACYACMHFDETGTPEQKLPLGMGWCVLKDEAHYSGYVCDEMEPRMWHQQQEDADMQLWDTISKDEIEE